MFFGGGTKLPGAGCVFGFVWWSLCWRRHTCKSASEAATYQSASQPPTQSQNIHHIISLMLVQQQYVMYPLQMKASTYRLPGIVNYYWSRLSSRSYGSNNQPPTFWVKFCRPLAMSLLFTTYALCPRVDVQYNNKNNNNVPGILIVIPGIIIPGDKKK